MQDMLGMRRNIEKTKWRQLGLRGLHGRPKTVQSQTTRPQGSCFGLLGLNASATPRVISQCWVGFVRA